MMLIGVDYHPSFQTIAYFVEEAGEYDEQELNHSDGQAEKFYRGLKQRVCSTEYQVNLLFFPQSPALDSPDSLAFAEQSS
jgi:hypothetical protein